MDPQFENRRRDFSANVSYSAADKEKSRFLKPVLIALVTVAIGGGGYIAGGYRLIEKVFSSGQHGAVSSDSGGNKSGQCAGSIGFCSVVNNYPSPAPYNPPVMATDQPSYDWFDPRSDAPSPGFSQKYDYVIVVPKDQKSGRRLKDAIESRRFRIAPELNESMMSYSGKVLYGSCAFDRYLTCYFPKGFGRETPIRVSPNSRIFEK